MHRGEKPYKCGFEGCSKTFTTSSNRDDHRRRHINNRPYACDVKGCPSAYFRKYQLVKHKEMKHNQEATPEELQE